MNGGLCRTEDFYKMANYLGIPRGIYDPLKEVE
jgi:hypothetical protein